MNTMMMKKLNRKSMALAGVLTLALAACTADRDANEAARPLPAGAPQALTLTLGGYGHEGGAAGELTRATSTVGSESYCPFQENDVVRVRFAGATGANRPLVDYTIGSLSGSVATLTALSSRTGEDQPYLIDPTVAATSAVYAYWPLREGSNKPYVTDATTWTVPLQQTDEAYRKADLCYGKGWLNHRNGFVYSTEALATAGTSTAATERTLHMLHQMAKLKVTVTNQSGATITGIYLEQGYRTVKLTHQANGAMIVGTTNNSISTLGSKQTVADHSDLSDALSAKDGERLAMLPAASTDASLTACALLPPQQLSMSEVSLVVETAQGRASFRLYQGTADAKTNVTLLSHHQYNIAIKFTPALIGQTVDVGAWIDGGSQTLTATKGIIPFTVGGTTFNMVRVEGGDYTTLGGKNVTGSLSDFYIGETELTRGVVNAVMGSSVYSGSNADAMPAGSKAWSYWMNSVVPALNTALKDQLPPGYHFDLPTTAQWEWAARGGTARETYTYAGSNTLDDVGWYKGNVASETDVQPVAQKASNSLGLYDMTGNVWEVTCEAKWQPTAGQTLGLDYSNRPADPSTYTGEVVYRSGAVNCEASNGNLKVSGMFSTSQQNTVRNGVRLALVRGVLLSQVTTAHLGWVIASDGLAYPPQDAKENRLPQGVTAVAMIGYVGTDTNNTNNVVSGSYDAAHNHGLALAPDFVLSDGSWGCQDFTWANARADALVTAINAAHPVPAGCSPWWMTTYGAYQRIMVACGSSATVTTHFNEQGTPFPMGQLNAMLASCGFKTMHNYGNFQNPRFWTSTEVLPADSYNSGECYNYEHRNSSDWPEKGVFFRWSKTYACPARPCFAF